MSFQNKGIKRSILGIIALLVILIAVITGCGNQGNNPAADAAGQQIRAVRNHEMFITHPGVTNQDVFNHFMGPFGQSTSRADGNWYVRLIGTLLGSGESMTFTFRITQLDSEDAGYDGWIDPYSASVGGTSLTSTSTEAVYLLLFMYEAYSNGYEHLPLHDWAMPATQ